MGLTRITSTNQFGLDIRQVRPPAPLRLPRLNILAARLNNTTPLLPATFTHRSQPAHIPGRIKPAQTTRKAPSISHIRIRHRLGRHLTRLTALNLTPPKTPRLRPTQRISRPRFHLIPCLRPSQQSLPRHRLQRIKRHRTTHQPTSRSRRRFLRTRR